ncbi:MULTISPECIES: flagellar hook-associated protein FlgK [unclassified Sphingobium]|uniref:flagellar hook-associated protein FlgK n=1 Tax=unclassified Sphingobium TaxID=2611147 RepID=UPI000D15EF9F|nr:MULTISPECIES: flagellar hook-associated protein FlgK [unclassified Sphingobium]MBG6117804.1 flagellar hook-associated protein 1 FlgK [Sphingobium sp. JAI105]PSO12358.1 flagellar hook-associated protein FlgK [Sphingobium sp. AEW4]TWD08447.1 flagellar hook-associated protein 1 FlgK [Sphingobium sp. AEW010]TWD25922.1 flagellar hook-associated protein 1 FlgK [Sphingobium sp. AEW013]TWD28243.1 flagellar hook-associated protein 1 FlgK [Sphingobium sp. AEW001]
MSDLFIIGASGTRAYRTAMAAIGENIANASTDGYARRSVTTAESGASTSTMVMYVSKANFGGTQVTSINRGTDPYLDATVRLTGMGLGSSTARLRWLSDAENALNDTGTGIGALMTGMFQNMEKLAASPSDTSLRVTTLDSISRVAQAFNQTAADLEAVSEGIATEAQASVSTVNRSLEALADINNSLLRAQPGTSAYSQLLDSRDAALQDLTENLNVTISFGAHDSAQISYGGQTLVQGNVAASLVANSNADGTLALTLADGTALATPANGALGGLFSAASTVTNRRASLDTIAGQFVTDMNAWHAQGVTDAGNAGAALLSYGGSAASVAALITDPAELATRSSNGTLNGNLLTVTSTLRGNGSVEQAWTALIATHGNLLAATKSENTTAQSRSDQAVAAREAVSGVDLDMEAADLLRIQQAYSASAKILQVAKETIDSILQIL